jgi:hypothetical protein
MAWGGGQYTVTATAVTLTSALGLSEKQHCKNIDVRAKVGNAAPVYLGASNVTNAPANARVEIPASSWWSSGPLWTNGINTDEVFIVGTAADRVYIALGF